jgi:hypothetical protein
MPTKYGSPTLYEAESFPGAPLYFVRRWRVSDKSSAMALAFGDDELVIWGYSCRSTYPEDRPREDRAFEDNGNFPSVCFSAAEPHGEYGFTPLSEAVQVERKELEAALIDLGVDWVDGTKMTRRAEVLELQYGLGKKPQTGGGHTTN